jgi:hypothetical protein
MSENWLELLVEARDALRKVIKEAEPGTGWALHKAYGSLQHCIDDETKANERPVMESPLLTQVNDNQERHRAWKRTPMYERERIALEALAEKQLTINELAERINEAQPELRVYEGDIRSLVYRMRDANELDRRGERWRNKTRYRYFRRTRLEGTIAELDQAFGREDS